MKYKNLSLDFTKDEKLETELYLKGELVLVNKYPHMLSYRSKYYHCDFYLNEEGEAYSIYVTRHNLFDEDHHKYPTIIYRQKTKDFEIIYLEDYILKPEEANNFKFRNDIILSTVEQLTILKEMINNKEERK